MEVALSILTLDIVARTMAGELSRSMGQPIVVENRPSAASIVGTQLVQKAAPDGYTLLAHSSTYFTAPPISKEMMTTKGATPAPCSLPVT